MPLPECDIEKVTCPKCGVAMESIESAVEGLAIEDLQLCPRCYLVTWRDEHGFQIRQGVPRENGWSRLSASRRLNVPSDAA